MPKPVTLKDVAYKAGVSYQTVSKVIRNQLQVTPEVHARIQTAIQELDYHPNVAARNLRTRSSFLIGYSWESNSLRETGPILEQFQHSIVACAEEFGYHILLFPHNAQRKLHTIYEELVRTRRVDAFILSCIEYDDARLPILAELNVPMVAFGHADSGHPEYFVDVDGRAGIYDVITHLIAEGHRRIAIIAWPDHSRVGAERLVGYWDAMGDAGLKVDSRWVIRGTGEIEFGYSATCELLNLPEPERPTAIATVLDTIAIGAIQAVEACGYQVGTHVAVTGFDDMPVARHLKPSLTTVRQPVWDVGRAVIQLLMAQLRDETGDVARQQFFKPELIVRESSQGFSPIF